MRLNDLHIIVEELVDFVQALNDQVIISIHAQTFGPSIDIMLMIEILNLAFLIMMFLINKHNGLHDNMIRIIETSEERVLVREGGVTSLRCTTDQEWFFCLWRHPRGVKECIVQEDGNYTDVCSGLERLHIVGRNKSCILRIENASVEDKGSFMCLLNQADIFHTDQKTFQVNVATKGVVGIRRRRLGQSLANQTLELLDGEMVELRCECNKAFPAPEYKWTVPGRERVLASQVSAMSLFFFYKPMTI